MHRSRTDFGIKVKLFRNDADKYNGRSEQSKMKTIDVWREIVLAPVVRPTERNWWTVNGGGKNQTEFMVRGKRTPVVYTLNTLVLVESANSLRKYR